MSVLFILLLFASLLLPSCVGTPPPSPFAAPQGIGDRIYPARTDPHVFFFEAFEDEGYANRFTKVNRPQNRALVEGEEVFDGDRSLRMWFKKGENYGGNIRFQFAKAGMPEPEELYARYYLRFSEHWDPGKGAKFPGPAGTYGKAGWGGRRSNGENGWSARMGIAEPTIMERGLQLYSYTYHATMRKRAGDKHYWLKKNRGMVQRNRWYCIETYVKMNTPGKHDGILRAWVDGELAMQIKSLRFRNVPELKVEQFWMNFYYNKRSPRDMYVTIDNVALSTHPIGPVRDVTAKNPTSLTR